VIHRDLKLENILLGPRRTVKIADFGLASTLKTYDEKVNDFCGTPEYQV